MTLSQSENYMQFAHFQICTLAHQKTVSQLSWLERYTDNVEVPSSNLGGTTIEVPSSEYTVARLRLDTKYLIPDTQNGGLAQLARAPALHAGGHRFDSDILHFKILSFEF